MASHAVPDDRIRLKRAYASPGPEDGVQVLADRLWPRGLCKDRAAIDHWMKAVAPRAEFRRWFNHDPARWDEFRRRYAEKLHAHPAELSSLRRLAEARCRHAPVRCSR